MVQFKLSILILFLATTCTIPKIANQRETKFSETSIISYWQNGNVKSVKTMALGKVVKEIQYFETSALEEERSWINENLILTNKFHYNGRVQSTFFSDSTGRFCNFLVGYFENGEVENYFECVPCDSLKFIKLISNDNIVDIGVFHGNQMTYFDNGTLRSKGVMELGKRKGTWVEYNPDGSIKKTSNYY